MRFRVSGLRIVPPIMENRMEQNMENEMDTNESMMMLIETSAPELP